MTFTRDKFTLHFSMPLDGLDLANLGRAHVKRVMVPFTMADAPLLAHMASIGVRVVLRLGEADYYTDEAAQYIRNDISWKKAICPIDAVIVGVEPDNDTDLRYGAPHWDQLKAWTCAYYVGRVQAALQGTGVACVAPALTARSITEDDVPQPGQISWAEIMRHTFDMCDGQGFHWYAYNWLGVVDSLRMRYELRRGQELWHKPLWIDELGVLNGTQASRMGAYIELARMLETHPLGQRVEMLSPFVSNGTGQGWPATYLLRDPAVYDMLGAFMQGG